MTDEASFLAAIAESPHDQQLPLIFADWLDDHDDPRGQWIRNYHVREWMHPTYVNPIPRLLEALGKLHRVMAVRRAAEVIGEPIVPGLIELLKHDKERVRYQTCMCLRGIGKRAKAAIPALLEAMKDPEGSIREQAAKAVKQIGTDESTSTEQLKAALTDDNWSVRRAASKILGSMGAKKNVLQELVERFDSPDADDRKEVIESLSQLGTTDVLPTFERAITDPERDVRLAVIEAIGRMRMQSAVPILCRFMKDQVSGVRTAAARQFGYYNNLLLTNEAVDSLLELFQDPVPEVRTAAVSALGTSTLAIVQRTIPRIIALLDDLYQPVQEAAMLTLTGIARQNCDALAALRHKLKNCGADLRETAIRAVATVGRDNNIAYDAIEPYILDRTPRIASCAVSSFNEWSRLPHKAIQPLLTRHAQLLQTQDENPYELGPVHKALSVVESPTPAVIEALRVCIQRNNTSSQYSALEAARRIGPPAVALVPDIVATLNSETYYYSETTAIQALVAVGQPGVDALATLLNNGNEETVRRVISRLHYHAAEDCESLVPTFLRLLSTTKDDWLRNQVVQVLCRVGASVATTVLPQMLAEVERKNYYSQYVLTGLYNFGDTLLPYLPRLVELSQQPEFADWIGSFTSLFTKLAPRAEVREVIRGCLRNAMPVEGDSWNQSWNKKSCRQQCANGLLAYNDDSLLADLEPLLTDADSDVRRQVIGMLCGRQSLATIPLFRKALNDPEHTIRTHVFEILTARNDTSDETITTLVAAVDDRNAKVRRGAIDALNKLKVSTPAVLAALEPATQDDDPKVADRARIALKKLAPKEPKPAKKRTPK